MSIPALRPLRAPLAESGAELVALAEGFFYRAFAGALVFVGLASAGALVLLPVRDSASPVHLTTPTVLLTAVLMVLAPLASRRARVLYRAVRLQPRLELVAVLIAAALLAYPLRSELWWPSCALLMLVAIVAPLRRTWVYCVLVLGANLAGHALTGDLSETPAVSIIGLWIGFGFWATTAAVFTDRIAAHLLRLDVDRSLLEPPRRVTIVEDEPSEDEGEEPDTRARLLPAARREAGRLQRLTARQLEVVALLADGLRYDDVAACLSISRRQVQRHVAQAIERLGVRNANELIAVAVATGLVPPRG